MTSSVLPIVLVLLIGVVLFIPAERLLDAWLPGNHMGFGLMGVWFWIVLPASILLSVGLVSIHRHASLRGPEQARQIRYLGWFLTALLYVASTWLYRKTG
jgi:uncharacterized BrkB/YihY/UPF0761 family membrane protein